MPKTSLNKNVFSIPKFVLLIGQALQYISPKFASRYAFKLFVTPYKFKRPEREDEFYITASKSMLLVKSLQKKIQVYQYGNSKKKVLLIHGWAGRGTQMYKIAESFVKNGYMSVSFDGTAHGDSEGKTSAMPEFIDSMFEIEKEFGPFDIAIGHSLGGMALLNAVKKGFKVRKIAIIGSGNSITGICKQFISRLGLKPKVADLLKQKLDNELGEDSEVLSAYVAAQSVKTPTIVVHDTEDYDVPVHCAYDIQKNLKNSEIFITEGLGHRRILSDNKVIDKIIRFFDGL